MKKAKYHDYCRISNSIDKTALAIKAQRRFVSPELCSDPDAPTPGEVRAGSEIMRQMRRNWHDGGRSMFLAGQPITDCWNRFQEAGWSEAAANFDDGTNGSGGFGDDGDSVRRERIIYQVKQAATKTEYKRALQAAYCFDASLCVVLERMYDGSGQYEQRTVSTQPESHNGSQVNQAAQPGGWQATAVVGKWAVTCPCFENEADAREWAIEQIAGGIMGKTNATALAKTNGRNLPDRTHLGDRLFGSGGPAAHGDDDAAAAGRAR